MEKKFSVPFFIYICTMENKNLRVSNCPHIGELVVQVYQGLPHDGDEWLCCHNVDIYAWEDEPEKDAHDVAELQRDPSGETCDWFNEYLISLKEKKNGYVDYD